jgi:uncharacterized protein
VRSEFYISFVKHIRHFPRKYEFDYRFFWTRFNLDELDELHAKTPFFSRNKLNLIAFYDKDHIHLGYNSLKENVTAFLRENGVTEEIKSIELVTNPRVLGYTFNPVSFYFIETVTGPYMIAEVGNTFHELKPYLVTPEAFSHGEWTFSTKKHFYVSPFTSLENSMTFKVRRKEKSLVINIDDYAANGELEVQAIFSGVSHPWTTRNILKLLASYPFITFRIITAIHYHALRLFLMKVPFRKKKEALHLQTGRFVWDRDAYRKKT